MKIINIENFIDRTIMIIKVGKEELKIIHELLIEEKSHLERGIEYNKRVANLPALNSCKNKLKKVKKLLKSVK